MARTPYAITVTGLLQVSAFGSICPPSDPLIFPCVFSCCSLLLSAGFRQGETLINQSGLIPIAFRRSDKQFIFRARFFSRSGGVKGYFFLFGSLTNRGLKVCGWAVVCVVSDVGT